jgi:ribonuclease P protein component
MESGRSGGAARSYPSGVEDVMSAPSETKPPNKLFRRRHRLAGSGYAPVFEAKLRKSRGAITVHLRPNGLGEHRLGLSVGRRFGNAATRSRFKRMIREVFRLERSRFPMVSGGAYDIVVTARAHEGVGQDVYRAWMIEAIDAAHRVHARRAGRSGDGGG